MSLDDIRARVTPDPPVPVSAAVCGHCGFVCLFKRGEPEPEAQCAHCALPDSAFAFGLGEDGLCLNCREYDRYNDDDDDDEVEP